MPELVVTLADGREGVLEIGSDDAEHALQAFLEQSGRFQATWVRLQGGLRVRYDHIVTVTLKV